MRLHYYTQDDHEKNLGDWLTVPILKAMGHAREPAAPGEPVLFGIGTVLTDEHVNCTPASKIVVWGSGAEGRKFTPAKPCEYRAVRGPITRETLGLDRNTPLGDPSLLLPRLLGYALPSPFPGETLFASHCGNEDVTPDGFDGCVSMRVTEETALAVVGRIAGAGFVASESLHGCLIAAAFGVPWALCSPRPWKITLPSKYDDVFALLNLPVPTYFLPPDLGRLLWWWDRIGRKGKVPDVRPLLDSFPREGL